MTGYDAGRVAYEAYRGSVGGRSIHGESLPTWDEHCQHNPKIAEAWMVAGAAVLAAHGVKPAERHPVGTICRGGPLDQIAVAVCAEGYRWKLIGASNDAAVGWLDSYVDGWPVVGTVPGSPAEPTNG